MGWDLDWLWFSWLGILDSTEIKEFVVLLLVELLSELINTCDSELSSESLNDSLWLNLIASEVVVSNEVLPRLFDCK